MKSNKRFSYSQRLPVAFSPQARGFCSTGWSRSGAWLGLSLCWGLSAELQPLPGSSLGAQNPPNIRIKPPSGHRTGINRDPPHCPKPPSPPKKTNTDTPHHHPHTPLDQTNWFQVLQVAITRYKRFPGRFTCISGIVRYRHTQRTFQKRKSEVFISA